MGLGALGNEVPWPEVISLVSILMADPTSWLQTAKNKWQHPITYEWTIHAATYDLLAQVNSKRKPKAWPRPWGKQDKTHIGKINRRDARAILRKAKDGDLEWRSKVQ